MKCPSCRGLGVVAFQIAVDDSDIDICLDCEGTGVVPEIALGVEITSDLTELIRAKNEDTYKEAV